MIFVPSLALRHSSGAFPLDSCEQLAAPSLELPWWIEPSQGAQHFPALAPCLSLADFVSRQNDTQLKQWVSKHKKNQLVVSQRALHQSWLRLSYTNGLARQEYYAPGTSPWTAHPFAWLPWQECSELKLEPDADSVPAPGSKLDALFWSEVNKADIDSAGQWHLSGYASPEPADDLANGGLAYTLLQAARLGSPSYSADADWNYMPGSSVPQAGSFVAAKDVLLARPKASYQKLSRAAFFDWFTKVHASTLLDGVHSNAKTCHLPLLKQTGKLQDGAYLSIIDAGLASMLVQYPGRLGYWQVGIPPSGPADPLSAVRANRALGNPDSAPLIEICLTRFVFSCDSACTLAVCGAASTIRLKNGPLHESFVSTSATASCFEIQAGTECTIQLGSRGARVYLAARAGFAAGSYLGSSTTFSLGGFGGWGGRQLKSGDALPFRIASEVSDKTTYPYSLDDESIPNNGQWSITLKTGPQASAEYFEPEWLEQMYTFDWEVHHNSDRTGIRLKGPRPRWSRPDGGQAGLHPSNLHDNAYVLGSLDFTGDMPIILGQDGPSLGGFVCPGVVADDQLWKLGQLRPGDRVRFIKSAPATSRQVKNSHPLALLSGRLAGGQAWHLLPCGDHAVLMELGQAILDIEVRLLVHQLMLAIESEKHPWLLDLTPGIRSLQVQWRRGAANYDTVISSLEKTIEKLKDHGQVPVASRTVWLPLSWDDPSTQKAMQIYHSSVRQDAPWCPDNIEFIRRINGLPSREAVKDIVFEAEYLVMGLGDVYLGAPVATPLDPRHRLVTTKYNPARTWTPENAVGIGGAYLCVYGMEGPGGYQLIGRTLQMWNRGPRSAAWPEPWLLRFFDRIRFYPVSTTELEKLREDFPRNKHTVRIEAGEFDLKAYQAGLVAQADSIAAFTKQQDQAYQVERAAWAQKGL